MKRNTSDIQPARRLFLFGLAIWAIAAASGERGIRVPWATSWPAVINPESVINQPISTLEA